ncbi:MAG: TolC family outer membrane protein [Hyphomicrobium sp.]
MLLTRKRRIIFRLTGGRSTRVALAATAAFVTAVAGANFAIAQSLPETLVNTYAYNPQLDAERARLRATDEDVARANAGYRPDISASADITYDKSFSDPSVGGLNGGNTAKGYSITGVQPIFRGFQVVNAVNAAEASVRAGRETLRLVEQDVLLQAVTAYGNVVRDLAILRLRENNVQFLSQELKATQDRFAVGEVTRTDVAQSQARRAQGVSDLDLAKANLKTSRGIYEQVVGSPARNLSEPNPNSPLVPRSLEEAVAIGNQENPQVVGALYNEQAGRYLVDQIRGELLPQAQVEATYSERFDPSIGTDRTESTSVVGRLNVPIYQAGGETFARVRQAKHTHVSLIQQIEQARSLVQSQVVQAWSELQAFRAQSASDRAQIEANRTALNGVREEEKVGQRTLLDVLDAQQELLNSQVLLETTKRNILVGTYALIAAIGRLNVAELGVASVAYEPETHYDEVRRKPWGVDITHDDGRVERLDPSWNARVEHEPVK